MCEICLKLTIKTTRTTSLMSFCCFYCLRSTIKSSNIILNYNVKKKLFVKVSQKESLTSVAGMPQ